MSQGLTPLIHSCLLLETDSLIPRHHQNAAALMDKWYMCVHRNTLSKGYNYPVSFLKTKNKTNKQKKTMKI